MLVIWLLLVGGEKYGDQLLTCSGNMTMRKKRKMFHYSIAERAGRHIITHEDTVQTTNTKKGCVSYQSSYVHRLLAIL